MQTYKRAAKPNSPKTPRTSARSNLFNLTDSNLEEPDTQPYAQETQDPNRFVEGTEYTECTEESQSLNWPLPKDLKGTGFSHADEPSQSVTMAATSQEQPTPSEDKPTIEKRQDSFLPVRDPDSGRSKDDPESLVPANVVRDLENECPRRAKSDRRALPVRPPRKLNRKF